MAFSAAKGSEIEHVLHSVLADGKARTCLMPAHASHTPGAVLETRVTRAPHNHLVMAFRPMHDALPAESGAAQLMGALEIERRLYLQLFNTLPTPGLVLTADGQILEANPEGAKLLGGPDAATIRGRSLAEWAGELQRAGLAATLREAVNQRQEFNLTLTGDPVRDVQAVIVNVDPIEPSPKLLFLAVDVSKEVLLQRKLLQTDRLSQLGALVSGVAHELNNPLAAIAAFAELLVVEPRQAELRESAEVIRAEAMRAGRIVRTLLDFARQRPRVRVAVDLAEIVDRVLSLQRSALKKARVRAAVAIPDDLPAVLGDPQELQQVVLNAVVNARQAVEASGRPGQVLIIAKRTDNHVRVAIEDEESVRRGMVLLAKRLGHEVTSVPGYDDARRQLAEPAPPYDALIVDVHLDEAHSGFDLFEELRVEGRGRERRIVFTTGDSISAQTRDHLLRSERPVLRKPFSLDELREMLDRVASD